MVSVGGVTLDFICKPTLCSVTQPATLFILIVLLQTVGYTRGSPAAVLLRQHPVDGEI